MGRLGAACVAFFASSGVAWVACSAGPNALVTGDPDAGEREAGTEIPFDGATPVDAAYEDVEVDADLPADAGPDAADAGPVSCTTAADGTPCKAAPDACHTDGTCKAGKCMAPPPRADGYNWKGGDDTARCCSGAAVHTTSDTNCGACGIACNASNGESCSALGGHYFCRGCVASAGCWSKCCSTSFSPYSCAASDCAGHCDATYCPAGTHCVDGMGASSDYCSY